MSYAVPSGLSADFALEEYTVPNSFEADFQLEDITSFFVSGTVKVGGSLISGAVVRLIQNDTYIDDTTSDASGEFIFSGLSSDSPCSVIAEYTDNGRSRFQGYWGVIPKEEGGS